jgi:hypothetical protein
MRVIPLHGEQSPSATFVKSALIDATHFVAAQFGLGYNHLFATGWEDMIRLASDQAPSATFVKTLIQ